MTEFNRWTGSDFLIVHLVAPFQDIKNPLVYFQVLNWLFKTKPSKVFVVRVLILSAICRHWGLSNLLQVFWKECNSSGSFTPDIFYIHRFFSLPSFSRAKCPLAHKSPALGIGDTQSKFSANHLHPSRPLTASDGDNVMCPTMRLGKCQLGEEVWRWRRQVMCHTFPFLLENWKAKELLPQLWVL